jgi:hypothetical protein
VLVLVAAAVAFAVPPPADAPLPARAEPFAQRLAATTQALEAGIEDWRATGSARPPRELRLWALHQQRLYLALGVARPAFGDEVVRRLPAGMRADARDVLVARRALVRLTPPTTLPRSAPGRPSRPTVCSATTARRSGASASPGTCSRRSTSSRPRSAR